MNEEIHCQQCDHDIDDHAHGKICQSCLWDDKSDTCTESPSYIALEYTARILNNAPSTTSDGYHTMDELYEYRMLYNALAANALAHLAVKSWRHSDGELCFGGGWFVVYLNLPTGQVSNHYKAEHWDLFNVPEEDTAPEYDGHTPAEAAERLRAAVGADMGIGVGSVMAMSDPIMQKLDEMQARCDAATEGPWEAEGSQVRGSHSLVAAVRDHSVSERRPDAGFIASARTDMPKLIDALKAVLAEHRPEGARPDCNCCSPTCACGHWEYPCPTVKAIATALGVNDA